MSERSKAVARAVAEELASSGVKLVASLPDNWIVDLIEALDADRRFVHVPVNREESAVGLCSGAYFGAMGSAAFMTLVYAITKINYTYDIPLFMMLTLRGELGDAQKHHVSNGRYMRSVLDSINLPYKVIDEPDDIRLIGPSYKFTRTFSRPMAV